VPDLSALQQPFAAIINTNQDADLLSLQRPP
jgi:hypothetical protein